MDREDENWAYYANQNIAVVTGKFGKEITARDATRIQSSEHTERDQKFVNLQKEVKCSRAAAVCLVLLCVLLTTAVIVLCIIFTQERQQLISKNENLTNERNQLTSKNENLTSERNQLTSKNENLTNERNQLTSKNKNLTNERNQLTSTNEDLINERNQLKSLSKMNGWIYYKLNFYLISAENKNWTESRKYCKERGADLIIINNREEQDFVKNISGTAIVYIGLTDSDVENTWKWVDGTNMISGFWRAGDPDGGTSQNCVVNIAVPMMSQWGTLVDWIDVECNLPFQWICEKNISQLILP